MHERSLISLLYGTPVFAQTRIYKLLQTKKFYLKASNIHSEMGWNPK